MPAARSFAVRTCAILTATAILLVVPPPDLGHAATTPAEKCAAAKRKLAGKKLASLTLCDAKAVSKGVPVDPACDLKITNAFMTAWGKAEAKGGCSTTNDETATENLVDGFRASLEGLLVLTGFPSSCTAAKFHAAGKKGACELDCGAKAALKALPLSDPTVVACLATCRMKFSEAFTKAEAKKTGACHTMGDVAAIEGAIDNNFFTVATGDLIPCPTGQIGCSGACVDPMTDPADCSGCGNMCLRNEGCSGGLCTCSSPFTLCGTLCAVRLCHCVNLQDDPNNCGGCGIVCPAEAPSCSAGVCTCLDTLCGSVCVNTNSDPNNCGSCGTVCSDGRSCNLVCNPTSCPATCCYPVGTLNPPDGCNFCCNGHGCNPGSTPPDEFCN
jgi:hypothetical protein